MESERDVWWGAPALILVCAVPDASPTYEIDVSLATQNVLLMANGLGLGTCILKCPELINFYPDLKHIVDLPPQWVVCMGVAVGFPKTQVEHLPVPPRPSATDPEFVQWRLLDDKPIKRYNDLQPGPHIGVFDVGAITEQHPIHRATTTAGSPP